MTRLSRFSTGTMRRSLSRLPGAMFAIALMVESGCLIPQSIDATDADAGPHPAPHIVIEQIPDYMQTPVLILDRQDQLDAAESSACHCELQLNVNQVEEEDPAVTLQARWFLDYDPQDAGTHAVLPPISDMNGLFDGPTIRTVPIFHLDADALGFTSNGRHIVEVVIADKEGFDNTNGARLPSRSVRAGYESTVYRMVVQVNVTQAAGQRCSGNLPSVRVNCK
jgi:hypothetical protein